MNPAYDINQILADLEQDIMKSYHKNMAKHTQEEITAGFKWEMWQAMKIKDLRAYRSEVQSLIDGTMSKIKPGVEDILTGSYQDGIKAVEDLAESMALKISKTTFEARFDNNQINANKLNALVSAVNNDMDKMGASVLRLTDDKYRQILFKSQFAFTSGSTTLYQAIDQASKDFLLNGINSIQYSDGKRVNIASYAEMAIRSASKQAYLTGEGSKLDEWGIHTVQVTSYGACSDTCLPWQGKVYIDDVYSSGKADGEYPLLSTAMSEGLYHPNCRHTHGPFFEGISTLPKEQDVEKIRELAQAESQQRHIERQIRMWKRVEEGSLDGSNKERASFKVKSWQRRMREHLDANPQLRRSYSREKTHGIPNKPNNFVDKNTVNKGDWGEVDYTDKLRRVDSTVRQLEKEYDLPVQNTGDWLLLKQQDWDKHFELTTQEIMGKDTKITLQQAQSKAKELMLPRYTKYDSNTTGEHFSGILGFNPNVLSNKTWADDIAERAITQSKNLERVAQGKKPRYQYMVGESPEAIATHEFGHMVGDKIGLRYSDIQDYYKKLISEELESEVSGYSSMNLDEFFAEVFTQYRMPNPSQISIDVMEMANKHIKMLKWMKEW